MYIGIMLAILRSRKKNKINNGIRTVENEGKGKDVTKLILALSVVKSR